MNTTMERKCWKLSGWIMLGVTILLFGIIIWFCSTSANLISESPIFVLPLCVLFLLATISTVGFVIVQPNASYVLVVFGSYTGTVKDAGFWWVNPFSTRQMVSLKIRNFDSPKIKVNDLRGNPIEIGAVIVWRVIDSAKAMFDVEKYTDFITVQCETAIRSLAAHYPYDAHEEGKPSLLGSTDEVSETLRNHVHMRLISAGIEVVETRISHLAYAPEIAQVMLRRQQAEAIIAARSRIVEGAVGMVHMALKMLSEKSIVDLDEDKKASMANNLLVALVSEHETTPILNTGTLYS